MFHKILGLILLTPTALAQIGAIKPDMTYISNNDRFDLSEIVSAKNRMFRDVPLADDDEGVASEADYRRQLHNDNAGILLDALMELHPAHASLTRRDGDKFAEDDKMNSFEGGTVSDFENNLKHFQGKPSSRRKLHDEELAEHEILLQNAVPILMKVDGFLKPPLQ